VSADGRWAYTLYANPEGEPFIHALDTERRTAACIDLDDLTTEDASDARLVLAGRTLRVEGAAAPLALVDTRTFAVSDPAAKAPPVRRVASSGDDDGGGVPWFVAFVALLPLAGLTVVVRRRRHASSA
jgi:MYXO-CTERM domain-containing protein